MLITIAAIFGTMWLWLGYTSLHDESLRFVLYIITGFLLILVLFGYLSIPAYKRKVKQPLEADLQYNQKIQQTGSILRLESAGKYNSNIVFQERGTTDTKLLPYNLKFAGVLIIGKPIILEYTPGARIILHAQLVVPLTAEEIITKEKYDKYVLIGAILIACIILLIIFLFI
jgi:hypothetical protein